MDRIQWLAERIDAFVDALGRYVSWLTLALVLLMSTDVILRYLFSIGSVWSQELEWHLLSPIVLLALGYALMHDGHLRVDVIYIYFTPMMKNIVALTTAIIGIIFSLLVVYLSIHFVRQAYSIGEVSPDPGGLPYRFLLKSFIPLGFGLLAVRFVSEALHACLALGGRPQDVGGQG